MTRAHSMNLGIGASFTIDPLQAPLSKLLKEQGVETHFSYSPSGQLFQSLAANEGPFIASQNGLNLVFLRWEDLADFKSELSSKSPDLTSLSERLVRSVREFVDLVRSKLAQRSADFEICLCPSSPSIRDRSDFLTRVESRARECLTTGARIPGLAVYELAQMPGFSALGDLDDPTARELAGIPYEPEFFEFMAHAIARRIHSRFGPSRKAVILDADGTLWSGVCAEDGLEGIVIDEPRQAIHRLCLRLRDEGKLLGLCSRNHEADVLNALKTHPCSVLKPEHFAVRRIDWNSKSESLQSIAEQLGFTTSSLVFIDDDPVQLPSIVGIGRRRTRATHLQVGDHVGLCLRRTPNLIAAMLGVLKVGAAYVPLDPHYPKDRLEFIIADSGAKIVLAESGQLELLKSCSSPIVQLDGQMEAPTSFQTRPPIPAHTAAYLIYTSGSTGRPKGVVIEHRNAVNFVRWALGVYPMDDLRGVLAGTTIGFDLSILEIFVTLSAGGTLLLAENVLQIEDVSLSAEITLVSTVPSALEALLARGSLPPTVRNVTLIGEPLTQALVGRLAALPHVRSIYDLYGPAETTTCSTWSKRMSQDVANVGRPVDNTRLYVLDPARQPLPPGVAGELFIGGAGVARGYLNRPESNEQRFVKDPFSPDPEARMFATGDVVRYLHDGRLIYLGRNDFQVKIRGHRVELGEIETHLTQHPGVRQACVLAKAQGTLGAEIIAFVGKSPGFSPTPQELRAFLRDRLSDFMVPARVHVQEQLPCNAHGKVDRPVLLDLDEKTSVSRRDSGGAQATAKPENLLECELLELWRSMLRAPDLRVNDNFFECGGHSLLALELFGEMERKLGCKLRLAALLDFPTVRLLAQAIQSGGGQSSHRSLVQIQGRGSSRPLYCIHAHGGHVLFYRDLARRLGDEQPVYGLQAPSLDGEAPPLETVEAMASAYLSEIRRTQPAGPYRLAGCCAGGIIALEMAKQLMKAGQKIDLLVLIETNAPGYTVYRQNIPRWMRWVQGRIQETQLHIGSLQMLSFPEQVAYLKKRWIHPLRLIGKRIRNALGSHRDGPAENDPLTRTQEAIIRAIRNYRIDGYPGEIILFKAQRTRFGAAPSQALGWESIPMDHLTVHETPGYPGALVLEPRVGLMAVQLKEHLRRTGS